MELKTLKPDFTENKDENFSKLITYVEEMKEEIEFELGCMNHKIERLKKSQKEVL